MNRVAAYGTMVLILASGVAFATFAEEVASKEAAPKPAESSEATAGEHKEGEHAKQPEKARPDSAVSFVANLAEVKKWQAWEAEQKDGKTISAWGESIKHVGESDCSEVAVAETDSKTDDSKIWAHFCVTPGGSILVERTSEEEGTTYLSYDDWKKKCNPTSKSPGRC